MELIFELFSLAAAFVAIVLLTKVRRQHDSSVKYALIALGACLGFDILEVLTRWHIRSKGTVEYATIETFTAIAVITALVYTFRFGEEKDRNLLGYAILCIILVANVFSLELFFGFIIRE